MRPDTFPHTDNSEVLPIEVNTTTQYLLQDLSFHYDCKHDPDLKVTLNVKANLMRNIVDNNRLGTSASNEELAKHYEELISNDIARSEKGIYRLFNTVGTWQDETGIWHNFGTMPIFFNKNGLAIVLDITKVDLHFAGIADLNSDVLRSAMFKDAKTAAEKAKVVAKVTYGHGGKVITSDEEKEDKRRMAILRQHFPREIQKQRRANFLRPDLCDTALLTAILKDLIEIRKEKNVTIDRVKEFLREENIRIPLAKLVELKITPYSNPKFRDFLANPDLKNDIHVEKLEPNNPDESTDDKFTIPNDDKEKWVTYPKASNLDIIYLLNHIPVQFKQEPITMQFVQELENKFMSSARNKDELFLINLYKRKYRNSLKNLLHEEFKDQYVLKDDEHSIWIEVPKSEQDQKKVFDEFCEQRPKNGMPTPYLFLYSTEKKVWNVCFFQPGKTNLQIIYAPFSFQQILTRFFHLIKLQQSDQERLKKTFTMPELQSLKDTMATGAFLYNLDKSELQNLLGKFPIADLDEKFQGYPNAQVIDLTYPETIPSAVKKSMLDKMNFVFQNISPKERLELQLWYQHRLYLNDKWHTFRFYSIPSNMYVGYGMAQHPPDEIGGFFLRTAIRAILKKQSSRIARLTKPIAELPYVNYFAFSRPGFGQQLYELDSITQENLTWLKERYADLDVEPSYYHERMVIERRTEKARVAEENGKRVYLPFSKAQELELAELQPMLGLVAYTMRFSGSQNIECTNALGLLIRNVYLRETSVDKTNANSKKADYYTWHLAGDSNSVRAVVQQFPSLNAWGNTKLHLCARLNDSHHLEQHIEKLTNGLTQARQLDKKNALESQLQQPNDLGSTPLMVAIQHQSVDAVIVLASLVNLKKSFSYFDKRSVQARSLESSFNSLYLRKISYTPKEFAEYMHQQNESKESQEIIDILRNIMLGKTVKKKTEEKKEIKENKIIVETAITSQPTNSTTLSSSPNVRLHSSNSSNNALPDNNYSPHTNYNNTPPHRL